MKFEREGPNPRELDVTEARPGVYRLQDGPGAPEELDWDTLCARLRAVDHALFRRAANHFGPGRRGRRE